MQASGVILAGGRSTRMKYNKAFAEVAGKPVIKIIINKFERIFDEILIITNDPEEYKQLKLPIFSDVYPRMGPVAGIHAALNYASHEKVFILGCDMPFISTNLINYMLDKLDDHDTVIPEIDGFLQPTSAVYNKKCIPVFTHCLENNLLKLILIFKELDNIKLSGSELSRFGNVKEIFLNVNEPEALNKARIIAGRLL